MADDNIRSEDVAEEKAPKEEAKAAKPEKSAKKKGPGLGTRIGKYFRDLRGEFKKVIWPTFPTVARNTGVTLAMCAVVAVIISVIDLGLSALIKLVLSLGG